MAQLNSSVYLVWDCSYFKSTLLFTLVLFTGGWKAAIRVFKTSKFTVPYSHLGHSSFNLTTTLICMNSDFVIFAVIVLFTPLKSPSTPTFSAAPLNIVALLWLALLEAVQKCTASLYGIYLSKPPQFIPLTDYSSWTNRLFISWLSLSG